MTAVDPSLLAKVRKCLALSKSDNPHAAAAALAAAQRLMAEHGISVEQLDVAEARPIEVTEERLRSVATATRVKGWEAALYKLVAQAFGCELLFSPGYPYAFYNFVGPTVEAQLACYAAGALQRQLTRGRAAFTRRLTAAHDAWDLSQPNPSMLSRQEKTAEVDAYCTGWVTGAGELVTSFQDARLRAAREADARAGVKQDLALRVLTDEEKRRNAVQDYMQAHAGTKVPGQGARSAGSAEAQLTGYAEGRRAQLHPAVGGAPGSPRGRLR